MDIVAKQHRGNFLLDTHGVTVTSFYRLRKPVNKTNTRNTIITANAKRFETCANIGQKIHKNAYLSFELRHVFQQHLDLLLVMAHSALNAIFVVTVRSSTELSNVGLLTGTAAVCW